MQAAFPSALFRAKGQRVQGSTSSFLHPAVCSLPHVPEADTSFKMHTSTAGMTSSDAYSWLYHVCGLTLY